MTVAAAIVGSGVGAVARHLVTTGFGRRAGTPHAIGTAVVNLAGALLLGLLTGLHVRGDIGAGALDVLGVGFCGGFTTFSTWMVDSVRLAGQPRATVALAANLAGMTVAGVVGLALATGI